MQRMKIGLIAAAVLAGLTALFYVVITNSLKDSARKSVESRVARSQRIYSDLTQLHGLWLANLAAGYARAPEVLAVLDKTDPAARQQAAYDLCEAQNQQLNEGHLKADIVAILDASGKIVGRNLNPSADLGLDLETKNPAVGQALKGKAVKDVWTWQERVHEVAVAPVLKADNSVIGAMVFAWVVSAVTAQSSIFLFDAQIGFFHAGKVYASSFVSAVDKSKEDVAKSQALSQLLFAGGLYEAVLKNASPTSVTTWINDGVEYAVVAAPWPGNFADKTSGFVVLASISDSLASVQAAGMKVVWLGLLAILVVLIASVMTALDKIEPGVGSSSVLDHVFETLPNVRCPHKDCNSRNAEAVRARFGADQSWRITCNACGRTSGSLGHREVALLARGEPAF